ncbi:MAG TPA: 2-oxoacid:ferredoxin oxidoreductase subunit beta, partial [Solirubrobacteraceae bacterium]|nr:2-oxoacid:ferredoxin oxidoreductase subunit beta [Solirubrobacteraceae bacterium]
KEVKVDNQIRLEAGQPVRFGRDGERGVVRAADGGLEIIDLTDGQEAELIVHDPARRDPSLAFSLARLAEDPTGPTPIGIFRSVERPVYGRGDEPRMGQPASETELAELLTHGDTWNVA